MNTKPTYDHSATKQAFQKGMIMALGIAFVPLSLIATALFLSGYQPQDFNANLRILLIAAWLLYVFASDRIANLRLWRRVPFLRASNVGEVITIVLFSGLLATLLLHDSMTLGAMVALWLKAATLAVLFLGGFYLLFTSLTASIRRKFARKRRPARTKPTSGYSRYGPEQV
jgi:magnesium-transporting ATPase (P-type)